MSSRKRKKNPPSADGKWSPDYGDVVRAARQVKGWTQGDLAFYLRKRTDHLRTKKNRKKYTIDCTSVCRLEAGRTYCGVQLRALIAQTLGIKPEDLGIGVNS